MNRSKARWAALILAITAVVPFIVLHSRSSQPEAQPEEQPRNTITVQRLLQTVLSCKPDLPTPPELHPQGKEEYFNVIKPALDSVVLPTVDMELVSLGYYYITGYSPQECGGSWTTASGATCHRSSYEDRLTIPTTCAIDKSLHNFGDLFYIPAFDRVFIAEDTGSAVKGKHLDLFYEEYADVVSFPTGYYEVFSVEYIYGTTPACNYDFRKYLQGGLE